MVRNGPSPKKISAWQAAAAARIDFSSYRKNQYALFALLCFALLLFYFVLFTFIYFTLLCCIIVTEIGIYVTEIRISATITRVSATEIASAS